MLKYSMVLFLSLWGCTATAAATFTANGTRSIYISGEVDAGIIDKAARVTDLAKASSEPIDIVINSPGGSVLAGLQFLSAMDVAKARGVTFRCVVPFLAASMGFQIFANCDERYALKYAMLLWHPVKISGTLSYDDMLYASDRIRALERPLMRQLLQVLGISRKVFWYHYRHETLWLANEFEDLSPKFLSVVDDIQNVDDLFRMQ